jgi:ribonuclease J
MSVEMGLLRAAPGILAEASEFPTLPRDKVVVLAAGSQGEPMSSMARIAEARLAPVQVEPGDQVIFSSRRIPGNERAIGQMMNNLVRLGAELITDHSARVHSSGHGFNEEQLQMISLCRPRAFVPLHGEYRHMVKHAALAAEAGVHPDRIFVTEDGFPLEVCQIDGELAVERLPRVQAGLVFVDGKGIGDVGEVVLRDRRILSESGIIVCVVVLASDGRLVAGPELATRGLVYVDENLELLHQAAEGVRAALAKVSDAIELETFMEEIRLALRRFFRRELDRKPLIIPMVIKLPGGCCE